MVVLICLDISRLVKLRDLVAEDKLQCNVPEIGRMKCLQELRNFYVKKETVGFELGELGPLTELAGELSIYNLENVVTKGEATNAKLMSKGNLKNLRLVWGEEQPTINIDIIDALKPHSNLGALTIINHFGATGPSWLYGDIWMTRLETLILAGVSWGTLPPFGLLPHLKELALINVSNVCQLGPDYGVVIGKHFMHLKEVKLVSMPELVEWVVEPNCLFFPSLLTVVCRDCPNLCVTPFSEFSCTNLCTLIIHDCPKLSLPAMPHTTTLTDISVQIKGTEMLGYTGKALSIRGYNGDLVFHHIDKVEKLTIADAPHFLSTDLKRLKSLKEVCVKGRHSMFSEELDDRSVVFSSSIHTLILQASSVSGKLLSNSLNSFPGLSVLEIRFSYRDHVEREIQFPSCSSLRTVYFLNCQDLVLVPVKDAAGIQVISSLQSLTIRACGKLFSRWPVGGSLAIKPFPISLRELDVQGESSMKSMGLLSNLTSLTHLRLADCNNLTMDGFDPLITVNLKVLEVFNFKLYDTAPGSIAVDLISEMATATGSFQLEQLKVDSISTVLVTPICNLLATTLRTLEFCHDKSSESSTEEQEKGLQLLTSLQTLVFFNCKLHHLPGGLHRLSSLMELGIVFCDELQCLPKDGFPTSLREVSINPCSAELKDQAEKFKGRNANLRLATHSQVPGPNESVLALQSRFAQIL